ncbi:MAG: hypothetical protein KAR51_04525, partial [Candidatus Aenigmarchaeota archaeon]|nr:hypothetical protein [Candidatus Aenigmarchaeota archaeon]
MSRSGLLLVLSIVLSLSVIIYSPIIGSAVSAVNLTAETITTPIYEININQSDLFQIIFTATEILDYSSVNLTIFIPPNNETSTDNEPYFIIDADSNNSYHMGSTPKYNYAIDAGYVNGDVVNFTFYFDSIKYDDNINIFFNATPIN